MKFFELKSCLTKKELQHIAEQLTLSSKTQAALFNALQKLTEDEFKTQKGKVYRSVFGKPFEEKHEQYLRNQISAVYEAMVTIISSHLKALRLEYDIESIIYFLNELNKRRAFDLLEKEWQRYVQLLEESKDYAGLKALYEIRIRFLFTKQLSSGNIDDLKAAADKVIAYNAIAANESMEASKYYYHFLNNVYTKLKLPLIDIDSESLNRANTAKSFYTPLIKANNAFTSETNVESRIAYVAEILKFAEDRFVHRPQYKRYIATSIFNLGVELSLQGRYEEAHLYFNRYFERHFKEDETDYQLIFLLTYSTNLINTNRFEQVFDVYRQLPENEINKSAYRFRLKINLAIIHIFRKEYELAYPYIDEVLKSSKELYTIFYARILLSYYFFRTKDLESAIRELENLEKHQQFNTGIVANETQACKWFHRFYKIKTTDDKAQKTKLKTLQESIQKEIENNKNRSLLTKLISEACN
jgi:hypothetical protein